MAARTWKSGFLRDEKPATPERVKQIVELCFHDWRLQREIDDFIAQHDTIDTTEMESIYLDAAVKFYLASPAMAAMFSSWHEQLPPGGVIVHYGTSSGTESAWLLHQAPDRTVLQVDGNDAAVGSGQRKLMQVSQGRATDFASIKRLPWNGTGLATESFADAAFIHRVPPFPLESRRAMLERAFADLKPGGRMILVEPNLDSGGNPEKLEDFVLQVGRCSALHESQMTEFDLAIVARVKQRCLNEKGFHLFQSQMTSFFLTNAEVVDLCEQIGFNVILSTRAMHGRVYQLVLEKPASPRELDERFARDLSLHVVTENYVGDVVPRRGQPKWSAERRDHYRHLAVGQMLTRRYGLESVSLLSTNMTNFESHVVVAFEDRVSGELAAMTRLIPFYDLCRFEGMPESMRRCLLQRKVMAGSIYYADGTRGIRGRELEIFHGMVEAWRKLHQKGQLDAIYAEIKAHQQATYEKLGFQRIGDEFSVEGWSDAGCQCCSI